MINAVNLREEASTYSQSLGLYHGGTLVTILGKEPGRMAPWYHVRIGQREGYVTGVYLFWPKMTEFAGAMIHAPLPVGQTKAACELKILPSSREETVTSLAENTLVHVLAEVDGKWLHVSVPQGIFGWSMELKGASGYLTADDLVQGETAQQVTEEEP